MLKETLSLAKDVLTGKHGWSAAVCAYAGLGILAVTAAGATSIGAALVPLTSATITFTCSVLCAGANSSQKRHEREAAHASRKATRRRPAALNLDDQLLKNACRENGVEEGLGREAAHLYTMHLIERAQSMTAPLDSKKSFYQVLKEVFKDAGMREEIAGDVCHSYTMAVAERAQHMTLAK